MSQIIAAFYKFVTLDHYVDLRQPLLNICQQHQIKGTILLAGARIVTYLPPERSE